MVFCGIGLHSNNSFVVVSDDGDKVVFSKRVSNNLTFTPSAPCEISGKHHV